MANNTIMGITGAITATINNQRLVNGTLAMPTDVIYQVLDYEQLQKLPTINGETIIGENADLVMTPLDELSVAEVEEILNS